jgi:multidrug efflux pump subunit AcrB
MTALAMIIGMAPMAIEPGPNSPLGRAVVGGLMFATVATLTLVPTLFVVAHGGSPTSADAAEPVSGPPSDA